MEEIFPLCPHRTLRLLPQLPLHSQQTPPLHRRRPPPRVSLSLNTPLPLPPKPHTIPILPSPEPSPSLQPNLLFLDSLGLDFFSLAAAHPPLASAPLALLRSAADFLLRDLALPPAELRRIAGMCPAVLSTPAADLAAAVAFLLTEAGLDRRRLRPAINRRPRLLVSGVAARLRPTLYFLQTLGLADVSRHTYLLSCSVEDKLIPRLQFLESAGLSRRDARVVARRFPAFFCYGIEGNLRPKLEFLVGEMGREVGELRDFPQYFSFSLENRIRPRHFAAVDKGVRMRLPVLLKTGERKFWELLEVCVNSSPPVRESPLWREGL